jgi:monomeric sarcosine oxidase
MEHYPVIVVGGGTMGSGAAWALGKRGIRALVLEQFQHVHTFGSHSGKIRIIRQAYAESPEYVPLVQRADALWTALESETGRQVLHRTGGLDMAAPGFSQARKARASAQKFGLSHEWLDGREIRSRWPAWTVGDDWEACYSTDTGFLLVEPALESLMAAATRLGVTLRDREPVREWRADGSGVWVRTDRETYTADRLIVTAGAWSGQLLASLGLPLTVLRKVVWWFEVEDPSLYTLGKFPIFIAETETGSIYGFPMYVGSGLRIANHSGGERTSPDGVDRTVRETETSDVLPFARRYLRGVTDRVVDSAVCLYTMSPDEHFVVDRHPEWPRVVLGAGFSGHGFKFATAIGEILASLALDPSSQPLPLFAIDRFVNC